MTWAMSPVDATGVPATGTDWKNEVMLDPQQTG
jgi:hypothetical protein